MSDFLARYFRRLARKHYRFAVFHHGRRFRHREATAAETVVVYQMGKVGSSTIVASLAALHKPWAIHHAHILDPQRLARFEANVKRHFTRKLVDEEARGRLAERLVAEKSLRRMLDDGRLARRWKVITLVRDPVARNLSSFCEILDLQLDYHLRDKLRARGIDGVTRELGRMFLDTYPDHTFPLEFFDTEMRPALGWNVFTTPFPHHAGYAIYRCERADVLLLRLEDLDRCVTRAFREFLGIDNFTLVRENVGSEKDYSEMYRRLLDAIRLPESYLSRMYGSKYATHFYTTDELSRFNARWRRAPEAVPHANG